MRAYNWHWKGHEPCPSTCEVVQSDEFLPCFVPRSRYPYSSGKERTFRSGLRKEHIWKDQPNRPGCDRGDEARERIRKRKEHNPESHEPGPLAQDESLTTRRRRGRLKRLKKAPAARRSPELLWKAFVPRKGSRFCSKWKGRL